MRLTPGKAFMINKHTHLLAVIVFIFLSSPYFSSFHPKFPIITFIFLLALMFILRTLKISRKVLWLCGGIGATVFLLQLILNFSNGSTLTVPLTLVVCGVYIIFLLLCIFLMGSELFKSTRVDLDAIVGGINIYLLLGFLWALLYYSIYDLDRQAFHFSSAPSTTYFFCFSLSTLSTIGFGDMFPINKWAMVLACFEGVTGQLFLAIFIARLVSLHAMGRVEKT
ncbi:MAG: ion channel [Candidatus Omnitrophota bacterium]